jgi:hypothetical protein
MTFFLIFLIKIYARKIGGIRDQLQRLIICGREKQAIDLELFLWPK